MDTILITPTRSRPEQLSLVVDCINNQTKKADLWVIVDDGQNPVPQDILNKINIEYKYIWYKSGLKTSTSNNSAKALQYAVADKYVFIDDDDYYPPSYVEFYGKILTNENEMVGNSRWTDYRLSTGYYRVRMKTEKQIEYGDTMCEWHGSGIRGKGLRDKMIDVLFKYPTERYNDCLCFKHIFGNKIYPCRTLDFGKNSAISLKDYGSGFPGLIESHFSNNGLIKDENFVFFKNTLGEDWKRYEKYLGRAYK